MNPTAKKIPTRMYGTVCPRHPEEHFLSPMQSSHKTKIHPRDVKAENKALCKIKCLTFQLFHDLIMFS